MKHDYQDKDLNQGGLPEEFFRKVEIPYSKTREEAWDEISMRLNKRPASKVIYIKRRRVVYSMVAAILLLAGIFSMIRLYTTTVYCPPGEHMSYLLPDGSSVELNADSKISYKPLWWRFERQVSFEGEGFFEVQKGEKFVVISRLGQTEVLGTSFNIYSRDNEYNVACFTGMVSVTSITSEKVVLSPEYEARINSDGEIMVSKESKAGISHSWIDNMFSFTSRPLDLVLKEIERQFHVTVRYTPRLDYSYTGFFSRNRPIDEVLTLICKPFGLTFVRISEHEYQIIQN